MSKLKKTLLTICVCIGLFALKTAVDLKPVSSSFRSVISDATNSRFTDRNGNPLNATYQNEWNIYNNVPLHEVPEYLQKAFVTSEDKRFYQHSGSDWYARAGAIWNRIVNGQKLRGASSITEQVVKMINHRPRNLWSKWLEAIEASLLETEYSKNDILEFYLNQVPYTNNRRGVAEAARYYFNRDLETLSKTEMLALAVIPRAPSSYDLYQNPEKINSLIAQLANRMNEKEANTRLLLEKPALPVNAKHFIGFLKRSPKYSSEKIIRTTLDASLQNTVQDILDSRVHDLTKKGLNNAAALVVDNKTNEIIAWVVSSTAKTKDIDAVTTPRQPGSSLKPFLYSTALENGWTAATIIDDSPMAEAVGSGLHKFNNYSYVFYGNITLREALANSLNIPAIKTIQFVGAANYLKKLHQLGFASLAKNASFYNDGLALGNGEVSLFELVQGYSALANQGKFRPLKYLMNDYSPKTETQIFSSEIASLIGNILSDSFARRLEFGNASVLNLPVQTAVKTGTSTDYRDAWAVGYNYKYTVGIWMGNLDGKPTNGVTGSTGPALALRSIFAELNKNQNTKPLYLSPKLVQKDICIEYSADRPCFKKTEYFVAGTDYVPLEKKTESSEPKFTRPTDGLNIAYDPRIPADRQAIKFYISNVPEGAKVTWVLNGDVLATSNQPEYLWNIQRGKYQLSANIIEEDKTTQLDEISFVVK